MANPGRSEESYGEKIDNCMYNSMVKFAGGVGVGIVCSVLLFKRKPWPMILGAGIGTGMGISDCNHEFRGAVGKAKRAATNVQFTNNQVGTEACSAEKGINVVKGASFEATKESHKKDNGEHKGAL